MSSVADKGTLHFTTVLYIYTVVNFVRKCIVSSILFILSAQFLYFVAGIFKKTIHAAYQMKNDKKGGHV